jgi:hypothetical protein
MHQTVKVGTEGSIGDLARITAELVERGFDIRAVGGAEANLRGGGVGVMSFLLEPDDPDRLKELRAALLVLPLDDAQTRTPRQVEILPGFDLEMSDQRGSLAEAAKILGNEFNGDPPINIMSALLVDVHGDWGIVSLSFEDEATRERAASRFQGNDGFRVMPEHGGRRRRERVNRFVNNRIKRGQIDEEMEDIDDDPGHPH